MFVASFNFSMYFFDFSEICEMEPSAVKSASQKDKTVCDFSFPALKVFSLPPHHLTVPCIFCFPFSSHYKVQTLDFVVFKTSGTIISGANTAFFLACCIPHCSKKKFYFNFRLFIHFKIWPD